MRLLGFFVKPSVSEIVQGLRDASRATRWRAICALEKMKHQHMSEAAHALLECRQDADLRVRAKVPLLLTYALAPDRCLPALLDMFFDEERIVRQAAAMALILCDWTYKGKESRPKQMNNLRRLLLAHSLGIHTDDENQCVLWLLNLSNLARKMEGNAAVYLLMSALKNRPGGVVATIELGKLGERAIPSSPLLIDMLRDTDFNVRSSAVGTLEQLTGKRFGQDYCKWLNWARQSRTDEWGSLSWL